MSQSNLNKELNYIHKKMFGFEPRPELTSEYIKVHDIYSNQINSLDQDFVTKLVISKVDIVSLEMYWRMRKAKNLLTQKIFIILFLTEVKTEYQNIFISEKILMFPILKLSKMTILSIFHFVYGWILSFKYTWPSRVTNV